MKPTVVLLHGLARTHRSVVSLRRTIERAGYPTWSKTYPSRRMSLPSLARELSAQIRDDIPGGEFVAVTHSLGGILVRHMAELLPWRGVVMIAPPNQGSRVARAMRTLPLYQWFYGPAGQDVADASEWPAPPSPFAIIAGTRGVAIGNPVSWLTSGVGWFGPDEPNDGTLAVSETLYPGAAAFATVDASHTWIMNDPRVQRWVLRFLSKQSFE